MDAKKNTATEQHVIDQIRRLAREGYTVRQIARISGKSINTVSRYKDWTPPAVPAPAPLRGVARPPLPSEAPPPPPVTSKTPPPKSGRK